jgi:hypothetical protein
MFRDAVNDWMHVIFVLKHFEWLSKSNIVIKFVLHFNLWKKE